MNTFTYTRDGQTVTVSNAGLALYDREGTLLTPTAAQAGLSDEGVTGFVLDLVINGWTLVEPVRLSDGRTVTEMLND